MSRRRNRGARSDGRPNTVTPELVAPVSQEEHLSEVVEAPASADEICLSEITPTDNLVTPNDDQGQVVELDFGPSEHLNPLAEEQRFKAMAAEGLEPFMTVMSYMAVSQTYNALSVICRGNNWQRVAFALSVVFHSGEDIAINVQKAKGYDRLRELVTTCVVDLRKENRDLPGDCDRLVHRLFTSRGIKPQFCV